jgi:hypothetical protein
MKVIAFALLRLNDVGPGKVPKPSTSFRVCFMADKERYVATRAEIAKEIQHDQLDRSVYY